MARMIESLITDQNLYKFSVDNHMNERIVHLCLNKWAKDCFAYKAKFDREEAYYSDTDREKAFCIISNNFKQIIFFMLIDWFVRATKVPSKYFEEDQII